MLASLLDGAWLFGAFASLALLGYGAFLVLRFQWSASAANQKTVARLALHDSLTSHHLLAGAKAAALAA